MRSLNFFEACFVKKMQSEETEKQPLIKVERVEYSATESVIKQIRSTVFQQEQGVSEELEFDGLDDTAIQLIAYCDRLPAGTARIRDIEEQTVKIERLAVLSEYRGRGIGKALTIAALKIATDNNYRIAKVHAQEYIKSLYQKLGFEQMGNVFEEANIPHVKMIKKLND